MSEPAAPDVQATACATWVDEWVRRGVRVAVVAPGSRSTPMAVALAARPEVDLQIAHDERTAAFIALGVGLSSGVPAALLCTSGTAATHFHAAVVEASLSGVPMLVLTADRPPELHGIGAAQTIDQQHLFGTAGRFADLGVPQWGQRSQWRQQAAAAWPVGGPVQVNLPFREPLLGDVVAIDDASDDAYDGASTHGAVADDPIARAAELSAVLDQPRGVVIAGRGIDDPAAVEAFAASVGWPVLADPRSGCRGLDHAVAAFDSLLRHQPFARAHAPSVVLHLGEPPASKVLGQWLQSVDATHVQVLDRPVVIDPLQIVTHRVTAPVGPVLAALVGTLSGAVDTPWWARWRHAAQAAQRAIAGELSDGSLSEPGVARWLTAQPGAMVVASSMPIRDVEWFGVHEQQAEVLSNRGANGIDGVIATGIGVALGRSDRRCTVLLGDVALLHDSSSFTALARREVQVRVVVVDNDGGGIFSFLPQATALPHERFEQLFGTPHGTDLAALARAHGLWVREADTVDQLADAWHLPGSGVVRVRTDRAQNVRVHDALHAAVAAELG